MEISRTEGEPVGTMRKLHGFIIAVVIIAAVLAMVGWGAVVADTVYHRGTGGVPETLDPHKASTLVEMNILRDLYEGLVTYDANAELIPGAADHWEISGDGTVYTFHMRENAEWSNGEPVTAGDFVFSFRRIVAPETASRYAAALYPIRNARKVSAGKLDPSELGVTAIDDKTLEIALEASTPYFMDLLGHPSAVPVHPPSVEKYGDAFVKPGNMVSNGAYMLEDTVPNARITLFKNPYFHDASTVAIDEVVFHPVEDSSSALRRFIAGDFDSVDTVPTGQAAWMRGHLGNRFHVSPYLGVEYYAINTAKPPFDDPHVRQALSMAIDREFLAGKIWNGTMLPGYSFVPPGIPSYGEPVMPIYKEQSILDREDEAMALMRQAGYGPDNPLKITLRYNTKEKHKKTALAVAEMWKPLGVEVALVNSDAATHYAMLKNKGDFDIARASWIADYADAQNFLFLLQGDNPRLNYASYANPAFDALMDRAAGTVDAEERKAILHRAQAILERDQPNIPLMYYSAKNLISDGLKGWKDNILDIHLSRWMKLAG